MEKYQLVKKVIDEWDPIGLLGMGCPDDEYDPEIDDIVRLLNDVKSVEELGEGINKVFIKWFGEDLSIERCFPAAMKIWNRLA